MTTAPEAFGSKASPPWRRPWTGVLPGAANVMISAVLAVTWLPAMAALVAAGVALLPIIPLGLLLLFAALHVLRWAFDVERARARAIHRLQVPDLPRVLPDPRLGWWRRNLAPFARGEYWRSLAHHVVKLLLSALGGFAALWVLAAGIAGLGALVTRPDAWVLGGVRIAPGWAPLAGAGLLLAGLLLLWAVVQLDRLLDSAMLSVPAEQLQRQVVALVDAREGAENAAEAERRRIERDLHDGAQPRLVNLAMTLGMAKAKLDTDPQAARAMIEEAHAEAKAAVNDLRQLARGIHPAVLTDRGLDAALSALAARAPIPVHVSVDTARRLPARVESVAYFVVAEALTNVAKHAGARRADVVVTRTADRARITISDDGVGGARITDGTSTGLAGLYERTRAAQGTMHIHSPAGGPTILTVEIPCA